MSESDITLTADTWEVHARETVSTGEYESAENHITLEGSVNGTTELDAETRKELKARLLAVEKTTQEAVERTATNRVRDNPDWGVPESEGKL